MVMYPEVQKKAQAELDMIVGKNQLPTFDDKASLPYVEALVKECFRWHTVFPLGSSFKTLNVKISINWILSGGVHRVDEDNEYNGYFIPKGTVVFGNIW